MIPLSALVGLVVATGLLTQLGSVLGSAFNSINSQLNTALGTSITIPIIFPQGFLADVTIEEKHTDTLVVTENPVETGAAITDHAFKKPAELVLRIGYSNSNPVIGNPLYVDIVYQLMLALQSAAVPFGIITTKRLYTNMLIERLETFTDEKWANAMLLTVHLKQVILVNTKVVSVPASQNMSAPPITGATQSTGQASLGNGSSFNANGLPNSGSAIY